MAILDNRQLPTSYTLRIIFDHPVNQWVAGMTEIQKAEYLENGNSGHKL